MEEPKTVFFGPMVGELGWALSRWHAYCRNLRYTTYENCKCVVSDYDWRYPLYEFADEFIPLPEWFTNLNLEQDCYEAVPPDSRPGSITPLKVYTALLNYYKQFYNEKETRTVRTPRGCNFILQDIAPQMWKTLEPTAPAERFVDSLLHGEKRDIVLVSARGRSRASNRNVPEFIWNELVDKLSKYFVVIITGTVGGSFLVDKVGRNIINVIRRGGADGLDILIALLKRAMVSITSQSGPTLVSLLAETPSYIVGHESHRHTSAENWLKTPVLFRNVPREIYAGITADTMLNDIMQFYNIYKVERDKVNHSVHTCYTESVQILARLFQLSQKIRLQQYDVPAMQKEIINGRH